jgi:hypothetical protein
LNFDGIFKKEGHVILYDGFRESAFETLPVNLKQAAILTEKSMAVNNFKQIDSWLQCAQESGFTTGAVLNLSQAVFPNMCRHQHLARGITTGNAPECSCRLTDAVCHFKPCSWGAFN